jgi:hypothetical protein
MIRSKAIRLSPQPEPRKGSTMCDFSLQHAKSRPAVVADKLVSHNFGRGTIGFKSVDDPVGDATAVCILPGTELGFDKAIRLRWSYNEGKSFEGQFTTAISGKGTRISRTSITMCLKYQTASRCF